MGAERILVTGAAGFIGAPLVARLAATGAEVHAVSRRPPLATGAADVSADRASAEGPPVRWHQLDLEDAEATRRMVLEVRPGRIYHLASLVTGRRQLELVVPAFRANLASTVHLLSAGAETGGVGRIVLAGSMEEPDPGVPAASPYAVAKAAGALYAAFFHTLYQLPVVTARIFMVYGPGQGDQTKVVPASILAALAGERPRISSGSREVDWVYIDDLVEGLLALGSVAGIEGRTIDLGSGSLTSVREVVERICRAVGVEGPEIGAVADRPFERSPRADRAATERVLGWSPQVDLDEGLRRTIDALRRPGQ